MTKNEALSPLPARKSSGDLGMGGSLDDAYKIDQSRFQHWHTYDELAARNAGRVFERMEFE